MPIPRFPVLSLTVAAVLGAHGAAAQTVANLSIVSGSGQLACRCGGVDLQSFAPLVVKATDPSGNPFAGVTISWTVSAGSGSVSSPITVTAADGTSSNAFQLQA